MSDEEVPPITLAEATQQVIALVTAREGFSVEAMSDMITATPLEEVYYVLWAAVTLCGTLALYIAAQQNQDVFEVLQGIALAIQRVELDRENRDGS